MFVLIGITTAKAQSAAELARYSQAERVRYLGVIGQSKIELTFEFYGHAYHTGVYHYLDYKTKQHSFSSKDWYNNENKGAEKLIDSDEKFDEVGYFTFDKEDVIDSTPETITGKWYSMDGKKEYAVVLQKYIPVKKKVSIKK